jgi:hypothetical protein
VAPAERSRHRRIQTFIWCARRIRITAKEFSKIEWRFGVVPRAQQSTLLGHSRPGHKTGEDFAADGRGWRSHLGLGDERYTVNCSRRPIAPKSKRRTMRHRRTLVQRGYRLVGIEGLRGFKSGRSELEDRNIRKWDCEKPADSCFSGRK